MKTFKSLSRLYLLCSFFAGILIPFGFAPFHMPGLTILGLALLYAQLNDKSLKQTFLTGFVFGLGFMGFGVSWIYVSIHAYGNLNMLASAGVTCIFIAYLALFPGLAAFLFGLLAKNRPLLLQAILFSTFWCVSEYLRSTCLTGFPWLLLGHGQIDTPFKYVLPIVGVYGVSFLTCLTATWLVNAMRTKQLRWLIPFVLILITPLSLKQIKWSESNQPALSVGIIQANLSMRDKWDENLFLQILERYQHHIDQLMGKRQVIVIPESAIPMPINYLTDFIDSMDKRAKKAGSAVLLGIPQAANVYETEYYNTLTALGTGKGAYFKQHLVPYGEYIPSSFQKLVNWFGIPAANLKSGEPHQPLVTVQNNPIASLICYELAYPEILRQQLPEAKWIVSLSDDGWFGDSLAMYQQLQISQALSILTARYQIVANNDGLSSIINEQGEITTILPAFSSGVASGSIYPLQGTTPWTQFSDFPILLFIFLITFVAIFANILQTPLAVRLKRRYPYQST